MNELNVPTFPLSSHSSLLEKVKLEVEAKFKSKELKEAGMTPKRADFEADEDDKVLHLCDKCPFQTDVLKEFVDHVIENRTQHNLQCLQCSKSFRQKFRLRQHYKASHNEVKAIKCDDCRYQAISKEAIQSHRFGTHVGTTYACITCNVTFPNSGLFVTHLYSHTNLRGIKTGQKIEKSRATDLLNCNQCEYQTDSKISIDRHYKKHHRDNFKCKDCPYNAIGKMELVRHTLRAHHNESRKLVPLSQEEWAKIKSGQETSVAFICELCFKVVKSLDVLADHKRTKHYC